MGRVVAGFCKFTCIMSSPSLSLRERRGVANVLKATAQLLLQHWTLILKVVFAIGLPFLLLGGGFIGLGAYWGGLAGGLNGSVALMKAEGLAMLAGVIVLLLGGGLSGGGILSIPHLHEKHDKVDFSEVWTLARARAFSVIGVGLLYGGTVFWILYILGGLGVGIAAGGGGWTELYIVMILAGLIPGYLTCRGFILAPGVAVVENRTPLGAIHRAFSLVTEAFWQTTGLFVSLMLIGAVVTLTLQIPSRLVPSLSPLPDTAPWLVVPLLAYVLVLFLASALFSAAGSFAIVVQTYALKERTNTPSAKAS